jgi:tetratricopeptide (TPR) repeat protein
VAAAVEQFEASLRLDPRQPSALVNLAQIHFSRGGAVEWQKARELFERAYALAPDAAVARALIIVALRLKDQAAAARHYKTYATGRPAAAGPDEAPARTELGGALLEAGLVDEALAELGPAAAAAPDHVPALVLLARAHLARREVPAAGRVLESAVARGVDAAPVYAALAEVYEAAGHVENAIPAMRLAIERDPGSEAYRFRYGMLLTDTKAPAAAVIRLQEALREFPRSAKLWFALGVAHFADHKNADAAQAFEQALAWDGKLAPALAYLGMTYAELGQYDRAVTYYERALAADDRLVAAHVLAADALLKQTAADLARAETHLRRAVALEPALAPGRLALGKLYVRLNKWTEAATEFERALAAQPNLAEAHYQLGRVYTRLRRPAEAQVAFDTFKRLGDTQKEQAQDERRELVRRLANVRF